MPALFVGHGSPLNALADNRYTQAWRRIGRSLPRPKAILAISAHWYVRGIAVTAMELPATIHDFYGFPQALYDFRYPAPGSPAVAGRVCALLQPLDVQLDRSWGLDHGTWSVLAHMFPDADVPVVQLSIDASHAHAFHYELGKRLAPLRDEGILLLGSGNVVHNLRAMRTGDASPYEWALRFEQTVQDHLRRNDNRPLIDYERLDPEARLAAPTPEHYLPLLYVIGAQLEHEAVAFPVAGIDLGSISMLTVAVGAHVNGSR
jgi:4,5-DOPA dioxygenase extradiol